MRLFLFYVAVILLSGCSRPQTDTEDYSFDTLALDSLLVDTSLVEETTDTLPVEPTIVKDTLLDNLARYLGGVPQLDSNRYSAYEAEQSWKDYRAQMDLMWANVRKARLDTMRKWRAAELANHIKDSLWLFYPFSGPDFMHAQIFYPEAKGIIMAALEPVQELPDPGTMGAIGRDHYLDTLRRALRDILSTSYFMTVHMREDFDYLRGALPLFYFFLSRTGHELVGQEFVVLDSIGRETLVPFRELAGQKASGVRLLYRVQGGGPVKELYYLSADISTPGLEQNPGLVRYIREHAPFNTFIKSASYLMHAQRYSAIRDLLISGSASIFQDDTGIPFRYVKNKYNGRYYGEYIRPIRFFSSQQLQRDLDSAYKTGNHPMPFNMGYHPRSEKQHYMLLMRK